MEKKYSLPRLSSNSKIIDTHCHLDMAAYANDLPEVLQQAFDSGVAHIVTIGIDFNSSKRAIALARMYPQISATIGIHPHDVDNINDTVYTKLKLLYKEFSTDIVAYGEIGLDYVKKYSSPSQQRKHFAEQLQLADELDLPVVIHNREADDDTLDILKVRRHRGSSGVMHCFSGDYEYAKKVLNLGLYLSIPGVVTFKNAKTLHEVVRRVPLDRLICETDGPFLAPHPYRGKRNCPAYVLFTAQKIAQLQNIEIDTVAQQTTENARQLFNLKMTL